MKKVIISILALVIGVTVYTSPAFADASLNSGSGTLPTITASNVTTNPCGYGAGIGCWSTSATAKPGDEIAAQISVANTSNETAKGVTLSLQPSRNGSVVTFYGGGAATNAPRTTGTATVTLSQTETITELGGDQRADWRTNRDSTPQEVNISQLFGSGFSVGDLAPGVQVVLTVRFRVNGTVTPPPTNTCTINDFAANPTSIALGSTSSLKWTTTNCTSVSISGVGTNLATDNSGYTVTPTNTTTYTLTAYPGGATATATVTVTNNGGGNNNTCVINSFTASPSTIQQGNSSNLAWNTSHCTYVNISGVGNNLTASSSQNVSPSYTQTYTLTAYPGGATQSVTVTVNNGNTNNSCVINSFTASPSAITYGNSSNLNWSTTHCSYVNISGLYNNLQANGGQAVYPTYSQTYTLTAFPGGQSQSVTVTVYNGGNNNYCSINSFYVDSNSITAGQTTTLHWSASGTNYVYISGFGTEPAYGSMPISPYSSTSYTISFQGNNCSGSSQSVYVTVNQPYNNNNNYAQPQAITTVASVLNSYAAVLNGIAIPNTSYGGTSAWFEYGTSTGLGQRTDSQTVGSSGSNPYSANISGLVPHGTYYYRAVVQNQGGTAYGSIVPFTTPGATVYTPPTRVIVQSRTVTTNNGLVAKSQPSLFKLEVDSDFDHMCIGGDIDYTVNYQNISNQDLQNTVLRITFPGELTYASSSQGDYDVTDRTLTISLGDVQPGEQGSVTVHAQVNNQASLGKLAVITATIVYTNPISHAQEQAIAYSLITISNDCPALLGASVFGFAGFLPSTLLEWLLLILVILALIVLARSLYRKNQEPPKAA
ncbi:MAG TPA: hypothetical protein VL576_01340 [Candidatus Paceibacterota bacterium]|nr:hypothetical protein [Candidatus Paceibacterota bacterium]